MSFVVGLLILIRQIDKNAPEPKAFGECKLPIYPANDPDIDKNSGLRFGITSN